MYEAARAGSPVAGSPRPIRVEELEVMSFSSPDVGFRVTCSSGTYVRALLADAGRALGCGAHLTVLRRTRIGPFGANEATGPDDPGDPLPIHHAVAHLPHHRLDREESLAASHGRILGPAGIEGPYAVYSPDGWLIGVYRDEGAKGRPDVVLRSPEDVAGPEAAG